MARTARAPDRNPRANRTALRVIGAARRGGSHLSARAGGRCTSSARSWRRGRQGRPDHGLAPTQNRGVIGTRGLKPLLTWYDGAKDGIRTRDPHLGKVFEFVHGVMASPLNWPPVHGS